MNLSPTGPSDCLPDLNRSPRADRGYPPDQVGHRAPLLDSGLLERGMFLVCHGHAVASDGCPWGTGNAAPGGLGCGHASNWSMAFWKVHRRQARPLYPLSDASSESEPRSALSVRPVLAS